MAVASAATGTSPGRGKSGARVFLEMTIRFRILLAFAVVLALLAAVAASGVASVLVALGGLQRYHFFGVQIELTHSIGTRFLSLRRQVRESTASGNPSDFAKAHETGRSLADALARARELFVVPERRYVLAKVSMELDRFLAHFAEIEALQRAQADLLRNQHGPISAAMMLNLDGLFVEATRAEAHEAVHLIRDARERLFLTHLYVNTLTKQIDGEVSRRVQEEVSETREIVRRIAGMLASPLSRDLLGELDGLLERYRKICEEIGRHESTIRQLIDGAMAVEAESIAGLLEQIELGIDEDAAKTKMAAESVAARAKGLISLVGAGGVSIGLVVAWLLGRSISAPVVAMTAVLDRLAKGDFKAEVPARERGDEIGRMASAAQVFKETALDNVRLAAEREQAIQRSEDHRRQLKDRVDELSAAQAKLMRLNDALIRSNKELDDFAYIASHDLKEPLRGIYNYSNFLIEDYGDKLDADGRHRLETLIRLTQRMESLIDDLLMYSRVGRTELAIRETDLNTVVRDAIDQVRISLDERGVEVRVARPLPTVLCDEIRVGEVFSNLISNAAKYNDKPRKWVEIGCLDGGWPDSAPPRAVTEGQAILYVRDNGIGIPEKHHERVFQMFKRLHARDKYGGGTGVGMSIARKIVRRHGGEIWLESKPGEGTTFYFTLGGRRRQEEMSGVC